MPKKPIRPELRPLDPNLRQRLIDGCNTQPIDVVLHYIETGEITFDEMPALVPARKSQLEELYNQWLHQPDPEETAAWDSILAAANDPFADPTPRLASIGDFIRQYPHSSHIADARTMQSTLSKEICSTLAAMPENSTSDIRAKASAYEGKLSIGLDDESLNRCKAEISRLRLIVAREELGDIAHDYDALLRESRKYSPSSEMFSAIDDMMWSLVIRDIDVRFLRKFMRDVPTSSHIDEANGIISAYSEWETIKDERDIFDVNDYLNDTEIIPQAIRDEAEGLLAQLKREEIAKMEENPSAYSRRRMLALVSEDIVSQTELVNRGLVTRDSFTRSENYDEFVEQNPISFIEYVDSNLLKEEDITDVFLFGVPSTGKTCVLMGLLGSDQYDWNSAIAAGEYGDILDAYRDNMILPPRTLGEQFFCIHGSAKDKNGKKHLINVIELAGEQFLDKIAMNPDRQLSLTDMATVAAESFQNDHRKIFFIVIDPTVQTITHTKIERTPNNEGGYDERKLEFTVAQTTVIKKMINILADPANDEIMKKVDALHFIATKADVIAAANKDVVDCIAPYSQSVRTAHELCQPKRHQINEATKYRPRLYTFSLGKFYVGGTFEYDSTDSDKLMDVITDNTLALREPTFLEKMLDGILNYKLF